MHCSVPTASRCVLTAYQPFGLVLAVPPRGWRCAASLSPAGLDEGPLSAVGPHPRACGSLLAADHESCIHCPTRLPRSARCPRGPTAGPRRPAWRSTWTGSPSLRVRRPGWRYVSVGLVLAGVTHVAGQTLRVGLAHRHTLVDVHDTEFRVHDQAAEPLAVVPEPAAGKSPEPRGTGFATDSGRSRRLASSSRAWLSENSLAGSGRGS
jgi:hypothetical protein